MKKIILYLFTSMSLFSSQIYVYHSGFCPSEYDLGNGYTSYINEQTDSILTNEQHYNTHSLYSGTSSNGVAGVSNCLAWIQLEDNSYRRVSYNYITLENPTCDPLENFIPDGYFEADRHVVDPSYSVEHLKANNPDINDTLLQQEDTCGNYWYINANNYCPTGQIPTSYAYSDDNTSSLFNCQADPNYVCPNGQVKNDANECCDPFGRNQSYAVSQDECGSEEFVKIDDLTIITDFLWNECLNTCTGTSLPPCPKGKVYDSNGYCVAPILDDTDCASAGGSLSPYYFRPAQLEGEIINYDVAQNLDHTKCHNIAVCIASDGTNLTDGNGEVIYSSSIVSCGSPDDNSTTPDDNATSNQCTTCPSQYPIPTDAGSCANSNGETTYCPSNATPGDGVGGGNTNDNTNNITCGTCSLLGGAISNPGGWGASAWVAGDNGMCKRITINNITQIAACPTAPQTDNNISITPTDGNASLSNGDTDITCPCCPTGTKSTASGKCLKILTSGSISMMVPCPCDTNEAPRDGNSTEPLDNNGTDDNATGLQNQFGHDLEREIKKAYQSYTIFDTSDCGELSINADAYLGDPEARISDPLPLFRDVIAPYRNIIKNFLIFMAIIIGLFDFFKRS